LLRDLTLFSFICISGKDPINETSTLKAAGIKHGDMLYITVNEEKTGIHEAAASSLKKITKDGTIVAQGILIYSLVIMLLTLLTLFIDYSSIASSNGFRPGMMPLRSMKMHWTLNEFVELDSQFQYKISKQPTGQPGFCSKVAVDAKSLESFINYLYTFDFRCMRIGYLYGTVDKNNEVQVHFIYEPKQETTDITFKLLRDEQDANVNELAMMLGYKRVGWIFAHPPREKKFSFSGPEILATAEHQLESVDGVNDTTFITIKVTLDIETNKPHCDGWQVSKQCMAMVAENVLQVSPNLGFCKVNPTFTALVEMKPASEVDNDFFLCAIPILNYKSEQLICTFPRPNRFGEYQTQNDLKNQLSKIGKEGWTIQTLLADFHLLLYLCQHLSIHDDLPRICEAILNPEIPLDEGYQLIIRSIAGLN